MKSNQKAAFSVRQRGFTMAEMLVVMAIIMVLSGIAVPSGTRLLKNVRQMSLNRSAETIYMTAQRNLIAAKVAGVYNLSENTLTRTLGTVAGGDKEIVLPAKTISPTLYAGTWTISYDKTNWLVTAVYYSDDPNYPVSPSIKDVYNSGKLGEVGYYG